MPDQRFKKAFSRPYSSLLWLTQAKSSQELREKRTLAAVGWSELELSTIGPPLFDRNQRAVYLARVLDEPVKLSSHFTGALIASPSCESRSTRSLAGSVLLAFLDTICGVLGDSYQLWPFVYVIGSPPSSCETTAPSST